jgi:hypothetical protein
VPTYPPRKEPAKKREELSKRETELVSAIAKGLTPDKLLHIADKYRKAQLSMLKAKVHLYKENEYRGKKKNFKMEKLEELIQEWTDKSDEDIISEVRRSNNMQN